MGPEVCFDRVEVMQEDTICAPATPAGKGGVSIVRVSGPRALAAAVAIGGKAVSAMASHTLRLATLKDSEGIIDQAVVSYYKAPRSYTGEDVVEFSVHGSPYIVQRLMQALFALGVRLAEAGEFTKRAFLNGRMDLSQAEAVADLISGETKAAHDLALRQLRGGFSSGIETLRLKLLEFASLVELELDFGEEDVEFADRSQLRALLKELGLKVASMRASFRLGNAIKEGIPVAIIGKPNAGKSTLINALLHEERALVSDLPGTTRDTIEEVWHIGGVKFRFIDTAGLRESEDAVERMGIDRTLQKMRQSGVWLYVYDASAMTLDMARDEVRLYVEQFLGYQPFPEAGSVALEGMGDRESAGVPAGLLDRNRECIGGERKRIEGGMKVGGEVARGLEAPNIIMIANKVDAIGREAGREGDVLYLSAKQGMGMNLLEDALRALIPSLPDENALVLSNARHYEVLGLVEIDLRKVESGLDSGLPGDLLAMDIRSAIDHLGLITGKILADDILGTVFSKFCVGK